MSAAAARLATMPPSTAPADHIAWKRVMIERWKRCCNATAWAFIATSVSPSSAPRAISTEKSTAADGATPMSGRPTDSAAEVVTVTARLPRRSTSQPLTVLAASPPTPAPSSVNPRAAFDTPSRSCTSGSRADHDAKVAPLTKKTAPIAAAARRGEIAAEPGLA